MLGDLRLSSLLLRHLSSPLVFFPPFQLGFQLAELKGGNGEGKRKAEEDHGSMVGSVGEWGSARMGVEGGGWHASCENLQQLRI